MPEPVSLANAKQHLRLEATFNDEDDLLTGMIVAARRGCERYLNRSVIGQSRIATFTRFPIYPYVITGQLPLRDQLSLYLEGGLLASVDSVTYTDTGGVFRTIDPSTYTLDAAVVPALLTPSDVWPTAIDRPASISVAYTLAAMNTDDATTVAQAIRLLIGHWYRNRESVAVDVRGTPIELPNTVAWLLDTLRVIPFR
jgi:uncharacterized phiE125 gp8 family phage protein